jgi:MFS family permease
LGDDELMTISSTNVPYRLDRLPWSRWHWTVIVGLGITWILDGLEVTSVGTIGARLQEHDGLSLTAAQIGYAATAYLIGAVVGALAFGYLTDRFGRKKLFLVTLLWYLILTVATAFSWNFMSFIIFRCLTGMGIGGEYAAINSAIDELIPARHRGMADLCVNGTWWFGTMLGSGASLVLLNPHFIDQRFGWRLIFGLGASLAVVILFLRSTLPESPRWLMLRGKIDEAEDIVTTIENQIIRQHGVSLPIVEQRLTLDTFYQHTSLASVARTMLRTYPSRTFVACALMTAQAFLYNAIFFTESLVLTTFFGVSAEKVGLYIFPFAVGNLLGPFLLGPLFDIVGRKIMIALSYGLSGILLIVTGLLFMHHVLDARTITIAWSIIFFFASAGASAAYLTASEMFPIEIRATAIAILFATGTLVGGALAPTLFGILIATHAVSAVFNGYLIGATAMLAAAVVELAFGVEAARRPLEEVAPPIGSCKLH